MILNTLQTIASNIYYTNKKIENIEKELNNIKDAVYYLSQERQMDIRSLNEFQEIIKADRLVNEAFDRGMRDYARMRYDY